MQEAWAIREINDEVIKISKQLGVKNIIHYGGPGITENGEPIDNFNKYKDCLLYTSPSPRDRQKSRMPSSA